MPASTRDLIVTYGGVSAGGTSDNLIWGGWHFEREKDSCLLSFRMLVTAASDSAFVTARNAVEVAFSTPRLALLVSLGGNTELDLDPADNTGFNAVATIRDVLDAEQNTSRSMLYDVRIAVQLPAGYASQNGLRMLRSTRTDTPAGRATITFDGEVTAYSSSGARDQVATVYAAVLTDKVGSGKELGVLVLERVALEVSTDDPNKVATFRVVYEEVIYGQSLTGAPDDSEIVRPTLVIERAEKSRDNPEDKGWTTAETGGSQAKAPGGSAPPDVTVSGSFTCWLLKSSSTDLRGKWTSKVKPWLIGQITLFAQGGKIAVEDLSPAFDPFENKISCRFSASVFTGSALLEYRIDTDDTVDWGRAFQPVWSDKPTDAYLFQGAATITRVETRSKRVLGDAPPTDLEVPKLPAGAGWVGQGPRVKRIPKKLGIAPNQVAVTDVVEIRRYRYVTTPPGASGDKYGRR